MRYREPARSYLSSLLLTCVVLAGFLIDLLVVGGGGAHVLAWVLGGGVIVGVDALVVYAARSLRSITVTDDELQIGEESLPRNEILGTAFGVDNDVPVLGRHPGEGMPRGTVPLTLRLTDDRAIAIATRHPERLAAALNAAELSPTIRRALPADLELLPEIDLRAESLFRVSGMDLPALPMDVDELRHSAAVFVAGTPPVGFVQLLVVDDLAHIEEIAVVPGQMRRGIGTDLLEAAFEWARSAGFDAITLTTYADVPWNAPYYAARGFVELTDLTPELAAIRAHEADVGLDAVGRRMAMRRDL